MKEIEEFKSMTNKEIEDYFTKFSKEDLCIFAKENSIPYRSYYSKNKILNELIEWIESTMMFKRIGEY